jgi:hypothetical protein
MKACGITELIVFFSFCLDDMPMGTAGRRASNEFLVCGGYVYMHFTKRFFIFCYFCEFIELLFLI